jgi:RNA polymerase-binding transcription factor DksA
MEKIRAGRRRIKPKATTRDIVGDDRQGARINPKWQKHYKRLIALGDEIRRRQADLTNDAVEQRPSFSTHMADAGTDTYDRDFALGVLASELDALYQIEQALDRIRNGIYGVCELTGKKIEPARLEAIPWTRFSAEAEEQLEKEGSRKRARLGPRDTVARSGEPSSAEDSE